MRPGTGAITSIMLLAAWLGAAILVAGVVAPAAFAVLPTRTLAGALVGRVLPVLFYSGIVIGLVVAALAWPAPEARWRCAMALALAMSSAIAQFIVAPRIATIRASVLGAMDALDASDPRRQAFGRLHGLSVALMALGALAAGWCLVLLVRQLTRMEP
jgi:hypothetical protein